MNTILEKTIKGVVAFMLICVMLAFFNCSVEEKADIIGADSTTVLLYMNESATIASEASSLKEQNSKSIVTKRSLITQENKQLTSINSTTDLLYAITNNLVEEGKDGNGYRRFDLTNMNLKATIDSDQLLNEVMRKLITTFDPTDYEIKKNAPDGFGNQDDFQVYYTIFIGEYRTAKGYSITYKNNQATNLHENGTLLSIPPASIIDNLPIITEQMKWSFYQQAQKEFNAKHPDWFIQELSGHAVLDLATMECYYNVLTVYSTDAAGHRRGAIDTKLVVE